MADITVTAGQVGAVYPLKADIRTYTAAAAITAGQPVYIVAASGTVGVADANDSGKEQCEGIALNAAAIGQAVDVLRAGECYGFTLSGNYDSLAYLSDTAGSLADAAGTMTVIVGRVVPMNDSSKTKVLEVLKRPPTAWS